MTGALMCCGSPGGAAGHGTGGAATSNAATCCDKPEVPMSSSAGAPCGNQPASPSRGGSWRSGVAGDGPDNKSAITEVLANVPVLQAYNVPGKGLAIEAYDVRGKGPAIEAYDVLGKGLAVKSNGEKQSRAAGSCRDPRLLCRSGSC